MATQLVLLHGRRGDAEVFTQVQRDLAPSTRLKHVVRPDWRGRALADGLTWQLRREIDTFVRTADHPVLCTCPILGETAEMAGALRIDRATLRDASRCRGAILLVSAEIATAEPVLAVLEEAMAAQSNHNRVLPLVLQQFFQLHEQGDKAGFHAAIAAGVIEAISARADISCVILADTIMYPAAHLLEGVKPRILTIPDTGLRHALGLQERVSLGEPMTT